MTDSSKRTASQESIDRTAKRLKLESTHSPSRTDEVDFSEEVQPTRHILDDYDFYKLRRELYWLNLHDADSLIPIQDHKLPTDLLDWTRFIVPNYQARVGGGGYGDAFKGEWRDIAGLYLDIPEVVIKIMRVDRVNEQNASKRYKQLRREITVWNAVDHEHIVPFLGICNVENDFPGLISLFMENGDIKYYLDNNPDGDRYILMMGIALGLEFLHNFNPVIIHGDIKAANVLVNRHGQACLVDFGISSMVNEYATLWVTSATHAQGTTRWQAPELFDSNATTASDVYAWAMTCLEIMTGKPPFSEYRNDGAVAVALRDGKTPDRPITDVIEDHIWDFLTSCWNHNPVLRPTMTEIVSKSLVLMTRSVNARDINDRSILSLLAGRDLQRCFKLTWNSAKTSPTLQQAWDGLDPSFAIRCLLEVKSIDINSNDAQNQSTLFHAVKARFRDAVAMLIDRPECSLVMKEQSLILAVKEYHCEETIHMLLTSISPASQYQGTVARNTFDGLSEHEHQQMEASQECIYRQSIARAIPQIITILVDKDHRAWFFRYSALDVLIKLSEHDIYRNAIAPAIPQIIAMLAKEEDEVGDRALDALVKLSKHDVYRNDIISVIPKVIALIPRYSAFVALVKLSEHGVYRNTIAPAIPHIIKMLTDEEYEVRDCAVDTLLNLSEHDVYRNDIISGIPKIIALIPTKFSYFACDALVKLSEHDVYQNAIAPAVSQIIVRLLDENSEGDRYSRIDALDTLVKLSEHDIYRNSIAAAIPHMITMLDDVDDVDEITHLVVHGLKNLSEYDVCRNAIASVGTRLVDKDEDVRYSSVDALLKLAECDAYRNTITSAIPQMITMLTDEDENVRSLVSFAIAELSKHDVYQNAITAAVPRLIEMLADKCGDNRRWAVGALVKLSEHDVYRDAIGPAISQIIIMLTDEAKFVRKSAVNALVKLSEQDVYRDTIGPAISQIITMLTDEAELVRTSAVYALVKLSEHDVYRDTFGPAISQIITMLTDEAEFVRTSAVDALVKLSEHDVYRDVIGPAISQIITMLTDEDAFVRTSAVNALVKLSEHDIYRDAIGPAISQIITMLTDEAELVRTSAVNALVKLSEHDVYRNTIAPAIPQISIMLTAEGWYVGDSAATALAKLSEYDIYQNTIAETIPWILKVLADEPQVYKYSARTLLAKLSDHDAYRDSIPLVYHSDFNNNQ